MWPFEKQHPLYPGAPWAQRHQHDHDLRSYTDQSGPWGANSGRWTVTSWASIPHQDLDIHTLQRFNVYENTGWSVSYEQTYERSS